MGQVNAVPVGYNYWPNNETTRGMASYFLVRGLLGLFPPAGGQNDPPDCTRPDRYGVMNVVSVTRGIAPTSGNPNVWPLFESNEAMYVEAYGYNTGNWTNQVLDLAVSGPVSLGPEDGPTATGSTRSTARVPADPASPLRPPAGNYTASVTIEWSRQGCPSDSGSGYLPFGSYDPTPAIMSMVPDTLQQGDTGRELVVEGTGFGRPGVLEFAGAVGSTIRHSVLSWGREPDGVERVRVSVSTPTAGGFTVAVVSAGTGAGGFQPAPQGGTRPRSNPASGTVSPAAPPTLELTTYENSAWRVVAAGDCLRIGPDAAMPPLRARLVGGRATETATWTLDVLYTWRNRVSGSTIEVPQHDYWHPNVAHQLPADATWDLAATFASDPSARVRGGEAALHWRWHDQPWRTLGFCVRGTNPGEAAVRAEATSDPGAEHNWFIERLIKHESGGQYRQFLSSGLPVFGPPAGYGMMQLDPVAGPQEIWSWRANVSGGKRVLNEKRAGADAAWAQYMERLQVWNLNNPDDPLEPFSSLTEGDCVFSVFPGGGEHSFRDANWIKRYNGLSGPTGGEYLRLETPGPNLKPVWDHNPLNSTTPPIQPFNYVHRICTTQL